jgi:hypothetical protein
VEILEPKGFGRIRLQRIEMARRKTVQHGPGCLVTAQPQYPLQAQALTPDFWLVIYHAAASHTFSGVRVLSKMVPDVTVH